MATATTNKKTATVDYKKQATQEYDASYNQKVTALKNQLAQQQTALDGQKTGINANYDTQVSNQNLSNKKSKNNISNTALGRGLQNSSIVTSGLAEADQINNRLVGGINSERTGSLNDLESQKAQLAIGLQATLGTMSGDRQDAIATLARELEDRQFEKDYKNNTLQLSRDEMLATQKYQNLSLAQQKELANAQLAWDKENANAQLAWNKQNASQQMALERELANLENSYKYAALNAQKSSASSSGSSGSNNDAYNAYLAAYSNIYGDTTKTTYEKKLALATLANEMESYSSKNQVDLSDLIDKANKNSVTSNGATRYNGSGIVKSTR